MVKNDSFRPYQAPACQVVAYAFDENFLASGDFGGNGYPGDDLDEGDEYNC